MANVSKIATIANIDRKPNSCIRLRKTFIFFAFRYVVRLDRNPLKSSITLNITLVDTLKCFEEYNQVLNQSKKGIQIIF